MLLYSNYTCKLSLLCPEIFEEHMELEVPFHRSFESFKLVGYCNGVLCISWPNSYNDPNPSIYLWNPAIRKFKLVPSVLNNGDRGFGFGYGYRTFISFGFAPHLNDYKVLKFMYAIVDEWEFLHVPPKVEIFVKQEFLENDSRCYTVFHHL